MESVTFAQTTALLASRCQATHLSVLMHRFCDPLGIRIAPNSFVERINKNNFEELVS
uniref:Uncharacterized protein n=1 Tax=Callorhinchus milii TaxID=7868 RepID=V9LDG7_CALMI